MARDNVVPLPEVRQPRRGTVRLADSAVETVVEQIRSMIDQQNLGVGDALPSERELCERFASSRNTVREAMRILKTYGVVEVRPKIGAIIVDRRIDAVFDLYSLSTLELSRQTFLDTQGFRGLIEGGSVDILFERSVPADFAELRAINEAMYAEDLPARASQQDFRFHARLVSIIGNHQLDDIYRIMKPVMLKIMESGVLRRKSGTQNFEEHAGLVDALEARDRLAYQYRIRQHLDASLALFRNEGP